MFFSTRFSPSPRGPPLSSTQFWTDQINLFFPGGEVVRLPSCFSGSPSPYSYIIIFEILGMAEGGRGVSGQLLGVIVHFTRDFVFFRWLTSWLGGSLLLLGVFESFGPCWLLALLLVAAVILLLLGALTGLIWSIGEVCHA
jgi:hypothetical protein